MKGHTAILLVWAVFVCCVVVGSLLPATSPVIAVVGRMQVSDKVLHFGAYLALSLLPVIGFRDRRRCELRHVVGPSHSRRDHHPLSMPSASDSLPA